MLIDNTLKLSDFDYDLPKELIAQAPTESRDNSRLLVLSKKTGAIEHKFFYDIVSFLRKGDVLVMNNSRVFPARLIGKKSGTGGKVEIFLLNNISGKKEVCTWQCLVGGLRGKKEALLQFSQNLEAKILKNNEDSTWLVEFNMSYQDMMVVVDSIGKTPLPPYIKSEKKENKNRYQTVYAASDKIGSVAAPTAGLHFTKELLDKIEQKGIQLAYITLHVGLGTFATVKEDDITKHKIHSEFVEVATETIEKIRKAKKENRRVIAVGTTSARVLESNILERKLCTNGICTGWVNVYIYPGFKFKVIDAMITNFHLPKSTLLMLISALAGSATVKSAYQEAIKEKYRFFSYGDAMFIH
ncbi:tRNA preQ1(34) S-adenosylmethionine ribosyltransferase-isomerase QueA [Patescibacteria group bacterium]|nr:tRNA preQ1(34) S-adenosylmethionine ribosyltransferase-isomerase QueA [Patescibacteria group bacterium]